MDNTHAWECMLDAISRGTVEFKARMYRVGLGWWGKIPDQAGNYTTSIDFTFAAQP